jgi:hypothetical protein
MADPAPGRVAALRALFELYRDEKRTEWVSASGTSMLPWIRSGDWLLVEFGASDATIGEIVLVSRGEVIFAHRVVRLNRDALVTKGDNRPRFDAPVARAEILGIVRAKRRTPEATPSATTCRGARAVALARGSAAVGRATEVAAGIRRRGLRRRLA